MNSNADHLYDVLIVGAGPAGCACAYKLAGKGLKIALIDKDRFPRDKICGDAVSPDVVNQLSRIDPELGAHFQQFREKKATSGIRFFAPNTQHLDIVFNNFKYPNAKGYIIKRLDFDDFLFQQVSRFSDIDIYQEHKVADIQRAEDHLLLHTKQRVFRAKVIVGADGAYSVVNKQLSDNTIDKEHYSAGLRQYYENVKGFHENSYIELHFYKEILPGYFWIFPLENNRANVGLGMLSSEVIKRDINLKKQLDHIIQNHPNVKDRFKEAKPLESVKGFGLPMGSKRRSCSGDRFLLLGDAASLIDPFSGEGIGMAIRSARLAADHLLEAFKINRFDAAYNLQYDEAVYSKMWFELSFGRTLQRLMQHPSAFNLMMKIAHKSSSFQSMLTYILDNRDFSWANFNPFKSLKRRAKQN
ncbi:MAG: geranylgeranyl reductase family protein [Bacteroidota bacterium]